MLGDLLDNRYRIIRTLSKGGFGQTYIAEDTRRPGCPRCVMKHLKPIVLDPNHLNNARRLFHTEAIALEKLGHHPHIPRLLAYFEENNDFYLVQDLIRGYPLTKELKTGFKWLEADIYQLLYDVLSILIYVHDRGVIHRDIKPDNLIRQQIDRALVLVDFGSVKQIRTHLHPNHETGQTISIGTIGYMSTEQAHGRPRPNSDLYSLGIIGIQAATGIKPKYFQEDMNTGELVWRCQADISDGLADFLETMVAYHFKDRYLDARAALRALKLIKPDSSPRHALASSDPLSKSSYWSLTASRLASAITSLRPALPKTPVSQPTFIELPEPTEVSTSVSDKHSDKLIDEGLDDHQSIPKVYMSPLVHSGADATTAAFENEEESREARSVPLPSDSLLNEEPVQQEGGNDVTLTSHQDELVQPLEADFSLEHSRDLPTVLLSFDEMLSPLASLRGRLSTLLTRGDFGSQASTDEVQPSTQGGPPKPRTFFWVGGGVGAIALMLWGAQFGYQKVQFFGQQQEALSAMQTYEREGRYLECQQTLQELDRPSETLNTLGYKCAFQGVQQLVAAGEWEKAIAIANAMPGDANPRHNKAQVFIRSEHIRAFADAQQAGNLKQAMAIADEIDPNHPLQADIQLARLKWQAEEKLWVQCLDLLAQGKWQEASERVGPLETSPYFQERAKALRKEADLNQQQTTSGSATANISETAPASSLSRPSTIPSPSTVPKRKPKS